MKLHSSTLEKAMRRLVRAEMRASPALRRARRKQRRARHFSANNVIWRLILTGWFFAVIAAARGRGVSVEGQLAFVTFWAATQVLARAGSLLGALYGSGDLYALFHLPISDTLILRWQCQKFLRSILWTWVEFILGYWLVLGGSKLTVGAWFALIAGAAVQTAMIVILALVLVALRPSPLYARAAWLIGAAAFAGTVFQSFVASRFFDALQLAAPAVNSFLPGGWVSLLLSPILSNDGNWSSL